MLDAAESDKTEDARILLDLLSSVERDGDQSQRRLASELGIALGLVNAYLRRCVRKGLVKVTATPARRYIYYLTPQGFAEKSRLTVEYLSVSFSFFRRAKAECSAVFGIAAERGFRRIALAGISDLAEIAMICALDSGVEVAAVVDDKSALSHFVGARVVPFIRGHCRKLRRRAHHRSASDGRSGRTSDCSIRRRACAYAEIDPAAPAGDKRRQDMIEPSMARGSGSRPRRSEGADSSRTAGLRDLFTALSQAPAACAPDRYGGGAALSSPTCL